MMFLNSKVFALAIVSATLVHSASASGRTDATVMAHPNMTLRCQECHGSGKIDGWFYGTSPCSKCKGGSNITRPPTKVCTGTLVFDNLQDLKDKLREMEASDPSFDVLKT